MVRAPDNKLRHRGMDLKPRQDRSETTRRATTTREEDPDPVTVTETATYTSPPPVTLTTTATAAAVTPVLATTPTFVLPSATTAPVLGGTSLVTVVLQPTPGQNVIATLTVVDGSVLSPSFPSLTLPSSLPVASPGATGPLTLTSFVGVSPSANAAAAGGAANDSDGGGWKWPAIVGVTLGGVAFLIGLIAVIFTFCVVLRKREKRNSRLDMYYQDKMGLVGEGDPNDRRSRYAPTEGRQSRYAPTEGRQSRYAPTEGRQSRYAPTGYAPTTIGSPRDSHPPPLPDSPAAGADVPLNRGESAGSAYPDDPALDPPASNAANSPPNSRRWPFNLIGRH